MLRTSTAFRTLVQVKCAPKRYASTTSRQFTYFDNLEVKDGVAIVRFNGPNKMNTISKGLQGEAEILFKEQIFPNKNIKAIVFI